MSLEPSTRKRVVLVAGYARSLVLFRLRLIEGIRDAGHEVICIAPEPIPPPQLTERRIPYLSWQLDRGETGPLRTTLSVVTLMGMLRRLRPDVVLPYGTKPVVLGSLAAIAARVSTLYPMVTGLGYLFIEPTTPEPVSRRMQRRVLRYAVLPAYRLALSAATTVFVQNPDDEADLRTAGVLPRKQTVVRIAGSGIDLQAFEPTPPPPGTPVFLFIGRILRDKGILEFVQAAQSIADRRPGAARFQILGPVDSNPAAITADEVQAWTRSGAVEYLGQTDDVRPYLQRCSVLVLPSYREGTPRSVLEAMASGRAVITTDAPGCRETVEGEDNGFLVPPGDAASVAEACERFIDEPALIARMGRAGRTLAQRKFDVHEVNRIILQSMGLSS